MMSLDKFVKNLKKKGVKVNKERYKCPYCHKKTGVITGSMKYGEYHVYCEPCGRYWHLYPCGCCKEIQDRHICLKCRESLKNGEKARKNE